MNTTPWTAYGELAAAHRHDLEVAGSAARRPRWLRHHTRRARRPDGSRGAASWAVATDGCAA